MPAKKKINDSVMMDLYNKGETDKDIAKYFGVSQSAVSQNRKRLGLNSNRSYPAWKTNESKPTKVMVDRSWKLIQKQMDIDRSSSIIIWSKGDAYRMAYIRHGNSIWIECGSHIEKTWYFRKMIRIRKSNSMDSIREQFRKSGVLLE